MHRPNLLLVHSFPTNSILLKGLNEFLSDYFTVYFIDLPGFHKDTPAKKGSITLSKFSIYLDEKIKELDLDEYFVGGVSFGFLVVNNAKLDNRCKAILAMEPYINSKCLNTSFLSRRKYAAMSTMLRLVSIMNLERKIWKSEWFSNFLQKESDYPKDRIDTIIEHINPRTFFKVTRILMNYQKTPKFHSLPYFLIGNFSDDTINFAAVVEVFIKNVHELHITSEPIDHYPKELTKEYFVTRIPKEDISKIISYMNKN